MTASFPVSERNKLSRMLRSQKPGVPVCLTVTHLDSLVLARCGFNHSVDYRSAMRFGTAHLVEDPAEKERALDSMVDRFHPGRAALLRTSTVQELKATTVVGMTIDEASAKVRSKGVADEEEGLRPADLRRALSSAPGGGRGRDLPAHAGGRRAARGAGGLHARPSPRRGDERELSQDLRNVTPSSVR